VKLLLSPTFKRAARKLVKKNPNLTENLRDTLRLLEVDLSHPRLRTHKLRGSLDGSMASSVAYDIRIIFEIIIDNVEEKICFRTTATPEEGF